MNDMGIPSFSLRSNSFLDHLKQWSEISDVGMVTEWSRYHKADHFVKMESLQQWLYWSIIFCQAQPNSSSSWADVAVLWQFQTDRRAAATKTPHHLPPLATTTEGLDKATFAWWWIVSAYCQAQPSFSSLTPPQAKLGTAQPQLVCHFCSLFIILKHMLILIRTFSLGHHSTIPFLFCLSTFLHRNFETVFFRAGSTLWNCQWKTLILLDFPAHRYGCWETQCLSDFSACLGSYLFWLWCALLDWNVCANFYWWLRTLLGCYRGTRFFFNRVTLLPWQGHTLLTGFYLR